ncbi:MDIS1-interacting receptor like kinase 1 [Dichanthelium oligosanthes]|uniref:MDIS1-interacting receptor like kinase 1 n=1 Tax=Dichanthelium oligosanthes TaxID=888268 RepID=A0A1E5VL98_9POAL|nr:MDIS1-interacting receptor like kinase 1 [Dichanthelium oligosanthes]
MEIRSSLDRANATAPRSWGRGGDSCSWERVNCSGSGSSRRVSHLHLSSLYDISTVSSTHGGQLFWRFNTTVFSAFSELQFMDLSRNYPSSLGSNGLVGLNLTKLQYLNLSGNWLQESILAPLGELVSLQVLDLNSNGMGGVLPVAVFKNLRNMRELNLSDNQFNGSLPKSLLVLPHLKILDLSQSELVGGIPISSSSEQALLEVLNLNNNHMSGAFPTEQAFQYLRNIRELHLSSNQFSGKLSAFLFSLPHIERVSNNQLGGSVFGGVNNLSVGFALHLGSNKFEGTLPRHLSGRLAILSLYDNKLSGELDPSFWNLSSLGVLNLSGNRINGSIHPKICNLTSIEYLDLSDNDFNGPIPRCSSTSLSSLNLSGNSLSGDISHGLFSTPNLLRLDMRHNKLTGNLRWLLEALDNIKVLSLGWNEFEGQITPNLCKLCPRIIDFAHNKLSGSLPPCVGRTYCDRNVVETDSNFFLLFEVIVESYIMFYDTRGFTFGTKGNQYTYGYNFFDSMSGIDLSGNMLSGEMPWELGNLSHIKSLNLSNNFFSGQIPASFANMSEIESLDLSHNELTGSIPSQLTRLWMLEVFSVAYNNLSGCIPNSGQFGSFTMDSYQGNSNLHNMSKAGGCSSHGSGAGDMPPEGSDRIEDDPVLYAVSAASFVLAFLATVVSMVCHPVGRHVIPKSWCCG